MKLGSIFSGIEGFALAAKLAGIETVFSCEIDSFCREVIKKFFPTIKIYEDIRKTDFRQYRGEIDILTGGFPCQPFSVSGQRKGAEDDRYLWPEMLRVIDEVRPTWVIGENVAGITSMVQPGEVINVGSYSDLFGEDNYTIETERAEYVLETICRNLEGIGYSVQPLIIPACAVGAPHRRDRIWIIACDTANARFENLQQVGTDGVYKNVLAADAKSTVFKRGCIKEQRKIESNRQNSGDFHTRWREFPTISPIYTRNDGISSELLRQRIREDSMGLLSEEEIDEIFSKANAKLREEGVKASGNAIVPQVAYEILKVIKDLE